MRLKPLAVQFKKCANPLIASANFHTIPIDPLFAPCIAEIISRINKNYAPLAEIWLDIDALQKHISEKIQSAIADKKTFIKNERQRQELTEMRLTRSTRWLPQHGAKQRCISPTGQASKDIHNLKAKQALVTEHFETKINKEFLRHALNKMIADINDSQLRAKVAASTINELRLTLPEKLSMDFMENPTYLSLTTLLNKNLRDDYSSDLKEADSIEKIASRTMEHLSDADTMTKHTGTNFALSSRSMLQQIDRLITGFKADTEPRDADTTPRAAAMLAGLITISALFPQGSTSEYLNKAIIHLIKITAELTPFETAPLRIGLPAHLTWAIQHARSDNTLFLDALFMLDRPRRKILEHAPSLLGSAWDNKQLAFAASLMSPKQDVPTKHYPADLLPRLILLMQSDIQPHISENIIKLLEYACKDPTTIQATGLAGLSFNTCDRLYSLQADADASSSFCLSGDALITFKKHWLSKAISFDPLKSRRDNLKTHISQLAHIFDTTGTLLCADYELNQVICLMLDDDALFEGDDLAQRKSQLSFINQYAKKTNIYAGIYESLIKQFYFIEKTELIASLMKQIIVLIIEKQPTLLALPLGPELFLPKSAPPIQTFAHVAAQLNFMDMIGILDRQLPSALLAEDNNGLTALNYAMHRWHIPMKNIISPKLMVRLNQKAVPLAHSLAAMGQVDSLRDLNADYPKLDLFKRSPLRKGSKKILEVVIPSLCGRSKITLHFDTAHSLTHCAAANNRHKVLTWIHSINPDYLKTKDNDGNTPTEVALINEHSSTAAHIQQLLISSLTVEASNLGQTLFDISKAVAHASLEQHSP